MQWWGQRPDWNLSYRLWVKCKWGWVVFSIISKWMVDWKSYESYWNWLNLNLVFCKIGVTDAVLKSVGTIPEVSEEWMMADIRGSREGRQDSTSVVGRGSSWHVEGLDLRMRAEMSEEVGRSKLLNGWYCEKKKLRRKADDLSFIGGEFFWTFVLKKQCQGITGVSTIEVWRYGIRALKKFT